MKNMFHIGKTWLIIATIILAYSCNNGKENNENTTLTDANSSKNLEGHHCYLYATSQDTVSMSIDVSGLVVTGELNYNFHEKDRNRGKLTGKINGDTLLADYTFISEGVESIRQVAFVRKGDSLVEGYGESEEKSGKTVFKNSDALKFTGSELIESNCNTKSVK